MKQPLKPLQDVIRERPGKVSEALEDYGFNQSFVDKLLKKALKNLNTSMKNQGEWTISTRSANYATAGLKENAWVLGELDVNAPNCHILVAVEITSDIDTQYEEVTLDIRAHLATPRAVQFRELTNAYTTNSKRIANMVFDRKGNLIRSTI